MDSSVVMEKPSGPSATQADRFTEALSRGLDRLISRYHLKPDQVDDRRALIQDTLMTAVASETKPDAPDQPWGWQPALESPDLAIGTLTVYEDSNIPLHDHPGSTGLLLVLSGRVRIRSYRLVNQQEYQQQPVELEMTADETIGAGERWQFGPDDHNIHTLQSLDGDCRIFDVLFSPYQLQQRSFFMPIVPNNNAKNIYVTRLKKLQNRAMH